LCLALESSDPFGVGRKSIREDFQRIIPLFSAMWCARQTLPIPPSPRGNVTSYGPIRAPGPMATSRAFYPIGLPLSTSEHRRRLVAATRRISIRWVPLPPTRSTALIAQELGLGGSERSETSWRRRCRRRRARPCRGVPARNGGGPFLDAEQLGFEQGFNQGGAVDRHERPLPPATEFVDLTSNQLFADPAFPPSGR
jgi:hypothetical protein